MFTRTKLSEEDLELIEAAKETSDRLHLEDVHEVAAALRMRAAQNKNGLAKALPFTYK
jgi:hypothetical protein